MDCNGCTREPKGRDECSLHHCQSQPCIAATTHNDEHIERRASARWRTIGGQLPHVDGHARRGCVTASRYSDVAHRYRPLPDVTSPFGGWGRVYAIMYLCDSRLPSFAPQGVPSRGSQDQVTAGRARPDGYNLYRSRWQLGALRETRSLATK